MSPDETPPIAENETPKEVEHVVVQDVAPPQGVEPAQAAEPAQAVEPAEDAPLTKEQFAAQMDKLAERARAAGFNPIRAMAQTYAKQGMAIVEGLLISLENAGNATKKKKE